MFEMFEFLDMKIKKNITLTIVTILVIEFMAIFFSYSALQIKEYMTKAESTAGQNAKYIELCMNSYESGVSFFVKNNRESFMQIHPSELYNLSKEFIVGNKNVKNITFYNDSLNFSYNTFASIPDGYLSVLKQSHKNSPIPQWSLYGQTLLYSYPIIFDNTFYGCFILSIPSDALMPYSENTDFRYYNDISIVLRTQNNLGYEKSTPENKSQSNKASVFSHTSTFPLHEKGITIENTVFLFDVYKSIAILGAILSAILSLSCFSVYYFIKKYNRFLMRKLENLSSDIEKFPLRLTKGRDAE
jgi:hypothetical protein